MDYRCIKCKKTFDMDERVRCPFCGFRIVVKVRHIFKKRIPAR